MIIYQIMHLVILTNLNLHVAQSHGFNAQTKRLLCLKLNAIFYICLDLVENLNDFILGLFIVFFRQNIFQLETNDQILEEKKINLVSINCRLYC